MSSHLSQSWTPISEESSEPDCSDYRDLRVTFDPPLFLQRRLWILDILRREGIVDVLDIGCGEGELLSTLTRPASWLPPLHEPPHSDEEAVASYDMFPELHMERVRGLDVSDAELQLSLNQVRPPPSTEDDDDNGKPRKLIRTFNLLDMTRWEPLRAEIWKGGVEVVNENFIGTECIVSTEVIEHLAPHILPFFAPVLLGVYAPKYLLITTPSYTYNARFTAPGVPKSGYPDPTNRTDRAFRHDDHKFEWTFEEFEKYCKDVAQEWGYAIVEARSIGKAVEPDPWNREEELGGATSVCHFQRLDDRDDDAMRAKAHSLIASLQQELQDPEACLSHELLAGFDHQPHRAAKKPASTAEIAAAIKEWMSEFHERFIRFEELWYEQGTRVGVLCGGWIELLVRAIKENDDLRLDMDEGSDRIYWQVELVGGVLEPDRPRLEPGETSAMLIPTGWEPLEDVDFDADGSAGPDWHNELDEERESEEEDDVKESMYGPDEVHEPAVQWHNDGSWSDEESSAWGDGNANSWGAITSWRDNSWDETPTGSLEPNENVEIATEVQMTEIESKA